MMRMYRAVQFWQMIGMTDLSSPNPSSPGLSACTVQKGCEHR